MKFKGIFKDSYIQLFDDRKYWGEKPELPQYRKVMTMAEFIEREDEIRALNKQGVGVFFTPNPCVGGRKESDVARVEWVFVDIDTGTKEAQMERIKGAPLAPTMIIESQRSYHLYWRCKMNRDQFKELVQGIILYFNGDAALDSTNEVLRVPSFEHNKYPQSPFVVKLVEYADVEYVYEDLVEAYPEPIKKWQGQYALKDCDLSVVKEIPIKQVLDVFGVQYTKRNEIVELGEVTSALINDKQNYVNRFSGKPPSGSTIDVVMYFNNMDTREAIEWLKEKFLGIVKESHKPVLKSKKDYKKRYTWGTSVLNHTFAIIKREKLIVVYGTRGQGKTTYIFDMAWKNANLGHKVLFFSLEMERDVLVGSMCRRYAGITIPEEYDYAVPDYKQRAFEEHERELNSNDKFIFLGMRQDEDKTWDSIMAKMLSYEDLDLIVIDNLDLISGGAKESNNEKQIRIIQDMATFVSKYKVPIVLLHHQRKFSAGGKSSGMDDMSGSGKVPDTADYTVRVVRDTDPTLPIPQRYETTLILEKGREYSEAMHTIYFCKGTFEDIYRDQDGKRDVAGIVKEIFNNKPSSP